MLFTHVYSSLYALVLIMLPNSSQANAVRFPECSSDGAVNFMETISNTTTLFLTLSTQRSGSTWFVTNVIPTPFIQSTNEMLQRFHEGNKDVWSTISWEHYYRGLSCAFHHTHIIWKSRLNAYAQYAGKHECSFPQAFGFKIMYDQIPMHLKNTMLDWAAAHRVKMIHLCRKASLLIQASRFASRSTGMYQNQDHASLKSDIVLLDTRAKVRLFMKSLAAIERLQHLWQFRLEAHGVTNIHVWYEDVMLKHLTVNTVHQFILGDRHLHTSPLCTDLPTRGTAISLQHSTKCMNRVSDYAAVVAAMQKHNLRSGPACALLDSL